MAIRKYWNNLLAKQYLNNIHKLFLKPGAIIPNLLHQFSVQIINSYYFLNFYSPVSEQSYILLMTEGTQLQELIKEKQCTAVICILYLKAMQLWRHIETTSFTITCQNHHLQAHLHLPSLHLLLSQPSLLAFEELKK